MTERREWTLGPNFERLYGARGPSLADLHPDDEWRRRARAMPPGPKPLGTWCRAFDRCVHCGRSDVPHAGHGYCRRCYWKYAPIAAREAQP